MSTHSDEVDGVQGKGKLSLSGATFWGPVVAAIIALIGGAILTSCHAQQTPVGIPSSAPEVKTSLPFTGHVTDASSHTDIKGASVSLVSEGIPPHLSTDQYGIFSFPIPSSSKGVRIEVRANGYEPLDVLASPSDQTMEIDLTALKPPAPKESTAPKEEAHAKQDSVKAVSRHDQSAVGSPKVDARDESFLSSVSTSLTKLYGDRFNSTAAIRAFFDGQFDEQDDQKLSGNHAYFKNYCRFCFWAMPLHAEIFNSWFNTSSKHQKLEIFQGMKRAVLSNSFRGLANVQMDKIDPTLDFTLGGDIFSDSSVADNLLKSMKPKL